MITYKEKQLAGKMTQWATVAAAKPDNPDPQDAHGGQTQLPLVPVTPKNCLCFR